MPKLIKCTFLDCDSEVIYDGINKDMSFFKYPVNDRKRCEKWVMASNNPQIHELFVHSLKALGERKVCERHFYVKDVIAYDYKKLLNSKAVPISGYTVPHTFRNGNRFLSNRITYNTNASNKRKKNVNTIEIIEIEDNHMSEVLKRKRNESNSNASFEIIEINGAYRDRHRNAQRDRPLTHSHSSGYSKFLMGHELFSMKKEHKHTDNDTLIDNNTDISVTHSDLNVSQFDQYCTKNEFIHSDMNSHSHSSSSM